MKNQSEFITRKELCDRWRCSLETLKRRERARILTAYKLGKNVRYKLAEVEAIERDAEVRR